MIWHIAKYELYDNLNSLRFALAMLLLLALMITNAILHLQDHPVQMQKYSDSITASQKALTSRTDLYDLAQGGPGMLYKRPSVLRFCADGGDTFLPAVVDAGGYGWAIENSLKGFWRLRYPTVTPHLKNIRPDVIKVDWSFIVGYVLSLVALMFSYDSISGEREQGSLRLMLANPIPRYTIMLGKFLGAFISINIPFTLAVLVNLLMISTSSDVHLDAEAWRRLGIIYFIAILYMCLFLALGILVSARVHRSAVSLIILLLIWIILVVFMPNTLSSLGSGFLSTMSFDEYWERKEQLYDELEKEYNARLQGTPKSSPKRIQLASEYVTKDAKYQEHLVQEYLNQQIVQVRNIRSFIQISPVAILHHLFESFSGTGFERHEHFLGNVTRYARQYRQFVRDTDNADPESLHFIGVREGMSQKPVSPKAIPVFEDTLSLNHDFNKASTKFLLLVLFLVVLLLGTYLAFVRVEI